MTLIQENPEPQQPDQTEFHRLFMQGQRRIFGHILTLLPRLSDAEEVFQQTCVIILGKAAQFVPGTDFVRWACQIAQYEVYNYRRRRQIEKLHFNEALLDKLAALRLDKGDLLDAELDALRRCVEKLPPPDRHLIQDRYARKITSQALAAELGRPANTVYKAIHRIRRVLRDCIQKVISREFFAGENPALASSQDIQGESARDCPNFRVNENGTVPFTASAEGRP